MRSEDPIEAVYQTFEVDRFPIPSESQAIRLEKELRIRLPEDYRSSVLRYNGGISTNPIQLSLRSSAARPKTG
jgi:hypothetical protein